MKLTYDQMFEVLAAAQKMKLNVFMVVFENDGMTKDVSIGGNASEDDIKALIIGMRKRELV